MIYCLSRDDEDKFPRLFRDMFKQRADQFVCRHEWELSVNTEGEEIDDFDSSSALYVMVTSEHGDLIGSARLIPTSAPTLVNSVFLDALMDRNVLHPMTWECSRFCISPIVPSFVVPKILLAISWLGQTGLFRNCIAVYDRRMERVYKRYNVSPKIICDCNKTKDGIGIGIWEYSRKTHNRLLVQANETDIYFFSHTGIVPISGPPCAA